MQSALSASGGHYTQGYFVLMDMFISDLLFHIEVFLDLQQKLYPKQDKHEAAGFKEDEFYDVPVGSDL